MKKCEFFVFISCEEVTVRRSIMINEKQFIEMNNVSKENDIVVPNPIQSKNNGE